MKLLISILLLSCICLGQVSSTCKSILSDMISSGQIEGEKLQKFLNLQAGISLHRLAYASLRHSRSKEQFRLEKEILSMLEQMRDKRKSEPEFNKVYELFNHPDNKLSRTALAEVLPYLKDIINEQSGEQSSFKRKYFNIGLADVRMLAILAEREKSRDGRYAHSQFKDHAYDQSILNFTKIINSSVANSGEVSKAHKLESMQSRLNELNKQALNLLEGMGLPMECQSLLNACVERSGDKVLIEDGFMNLISKVIEESDTIDLHEQLRYDDVWLHVNSKISGTSSGDIDLQKDSSTVVVGDEVVVRRPNPTPRPKEVEFKFSEIDDRVVIENYIVQKVLDSIPYFFTREELESNMDFTLALAQAIDDGILAKKGKNRTFRYENAIYYLPETWNSEYSLPGNFGARAGELLSRRWNQFFRFDSEVDVSHIPKKDRDNFLTTLNDQAKDHEHAFSFEFKNKLYDIKTGKPIEKGLNNFLDNSKFIKQRPVNLAQVEQSPFSNIDVVAQEIKKGKDSYIKDGATYHVSGSPVDFDREYSRAKLHANSANAGISEDLEAFPSKESVTLLSSKYPEITLKLLADRDRAFVSKGRVVDLYKGSAVGLSEASQVVVDFRKAHGSNIEKSQLVEDEEVILDQAVAILNEDELFYEKEMWISHEDIQKDRNAINGLSEKEKVVSFYSENPVQSCSHFTLIDKQKARMEVFKVKNEKPYIVYSAPVQLGQAYGDERTTLKHDGNTNNKTGAGSYVVGEFNNTDFTLTAPSLGDNQNKDILKIRSSETGMENIISKPRSTNGDVVLAEHDMLALNNYIAKGCPVLILPESSDVSFKIQDEQLRLLPRELGEFSLARVDGKKNVMDYQLTPATKSKYKPIDLVLTDDRFKTTKSLEFLKALEDEKRFIMQDTGLTNEEYNELSKLAFGILGTESSFGEGDDTLLGLNLYKFKETTIGQNVISLIKEGPEFAMMAAVAPQVAAPLLSKISSERHKLDNSRGVTQIKNVREFLSFRSPAGDGLTRYPEITPETLDNPRNAAVATMFALASKYRSFENIRHQHSGITDENAMDYLYYLYIGSSGQVSEGGATPKFNPKVREANSYANKIKVFTKP